MVRIYDDAKEISMPYFLVSETCSQGPFSTRPVLNINPLSVSVVFLKHQIFSADFRVLFRVTDINISAVVYHYDFVSQ